MLFNFFMKRIISCLIVLFLSVFQSYAQELYPLKLSDSLWHGEQRELRYKPDGGDFVIVNGNRLFTRALYGTHTAFRVEAGDKPEFALYMPGLGGNFKFGIAVNGQSKWLTDAKTITARYRPGAMLYVIEDPLLGSAKLELEILAMADAEGFVLKAKLVGNVDKLKLIWVFGGASGKKFSRDGDMGPDPESSYYLKSENCKSNQFAIDAKGRFNLQYGAGLQTGPDGRYFVEDLKQTAKPAEAKLLTGTFDPASGLKIADATHLGSPLELYNSTVNQAPVISGMLALNCGAVKYFAIQNPLTKPGVAYSELPKIFQQAEDARLLLASRIKINTPDPYINTVGGTLGIAADAIWESPSYMHGAIGWRMRLNGWRGPYTADALGWHNRAKEHFLAYALSQIIEPESGPVFADTAMHLSRSLEKLGVGMFTSGYISRDPGGKALKAHHYDMNMPYIDELLRHYEWTGDRAFVKQTWPLLKRHLAWETRNFDADGNGLYDAYAAIWASDALQYSGGDVTHSSAYNYLAFKRAAQIAVLLGEDPEPYRKQAQKILAALNKLLWMPGQGHYAEFKDRLGNQLLHPAAALWTIYHSIDSEVPDAFQAYQSLRYLDKQIPHISVKAKGLDNGGYYTVSTTNWMPYEWSLNNVALAESMHTALANWEGGRTDEAFKLFKSEILASMFLGGSPGDFVQISHYDAIRGEAYRDFADPIGMSSRALVEGLFGIVPDALNKTLTIRPGLPSAWNYASFSTPDISFDFKRIGRADNYTIVPALPTSLDLKLQVIAKGQVHSVIVNGKPVNWKNVTTAVGKPVIEISVKAATRYQIAILWGGAKPVLPAAEATYPEGGSLSVNIAEARVIGVFDPQKAFAEIKYTKNSIVGRVTYSGGNYTSFIHLSQGKLNWWMPLCFNVSKAVTLIDPKSAEESMNSFYLQNNSRKAIDVSVVVNNYNTLIHIAAGAKSGMIVVPEAELLTGTNLVKIKIAGGDTVTEKLTDWHAITRVKLQTVDLNPYFNDKVTQIFRNKYLSPRPQSTTLQLPWQGIGDWPHPLVKFDVDDSGLRKLAGDQNMIHLPQGIPFKTPGAAGTNNIIFTSQWDNYPKQKTVPLSGKASHIWFLMAGSTNPMQSQMDNGELVVEYTDGTTTRLLLKNPETWWPIDQDYYTDGFAFALKSPRPIRIHLTNGEIVSGEQSKAKFNGKQIPGGAATVLDLPLDPTKTLKSLTLKTIANDVVMGLMCVTLDVSQ